MLQLRETLQNADDAFTPALINALVRVVACSTSGPNCCEMVQAPTATPPNTFCQTHETPNPDQINDCFRNICFRNICACQLLCNHEEQVERSGISDHGMRCSVVIPDGPPAAPLLAERKFLAHPQSIQSCLGAKSLSCR